MAIITQANNVNLIPGQVHPRFHVSQYDDGRKLTITLYNGVQLFAIPSGANAIVQGTKPDKHGFQYSATITGASTVEVDVTTQMTAVAGDVPVEVVIVVGGNKVATGNFILAVEEAALADDTILSETQIPLIEEAAELAIRIDAIAEQVTRDAQAASDAADRAEQSAQGIEQYVTDAQAAANQAAASATTAGTHATAAAGSAATAATQAGAAADSASAASTSAGNAATSATNAANSATAAGDSAEDSEAWAIGERGGVPVTSGDPAYENNAKYYAQAAGSTHLSSLADVSISNPQDEQVLKYDAAENKWVNGAGGAVVNDMTGATATAPGTHGLVPAPAAGDQNKALLGDGTWGDVSVADMVGASASADGAHGLVPAPLMGDEGKFLAGDGTWKASASSVQKVTQAQYDALTPAEKATGIYIITDAATSSIDLDARGMIATIEGATASKAYAVGDYLVYNGKLYKVTAAIAQGNALTVGGNIAATTVGGEIGNVTPKEITQNLTSPFGTVSNAVIARQGNLVFVSAILTLTQMLSGNSTILSGIPGARVAYVGMVSFLGADTSVEKAGYVRQMNIVTSKDVDGIATAIGQRVFISAIYYAS